MQMNPLAKSMTALFIPWLWLYLGISGCASSSKRGPADDGGKSANPHEHMSMASLPTATLAECEHLGSLSTDASTAQANAVFEVVGNRGHRLQHALWHAARAGFNNRQDAEVLKAFGGDWATPGKPGDMTPEALHPYCSPTPTRDWSNAQAYNPVGEDFLYMHHQMVGIVRGALVGAKLQCLAGWSSIADSARDPLPKGSQLTGAKSDATFQQLLSWDKYFQGGVTVTSGCPSGKTSCDWLETVSLSQLGMALELTTHNNLHMRYATDQPPDCCAKAAKAGGAPLPFNNVFPSTWAYDQQGYDWLADPYGAAVNPIFWKIHGYVDGLITKWLTANGFTSISENCGNDAKCYPWRGKWAPAEPDAPNNADSAEKSIQPAKPGAPSPDATPDSTTDAKSVRFNRARMLKQWTGVLGGPPAALAGQKQAGTSKALADAAPTPAAADPFVYAVQQECRSASRN